MDKRIEEQLAFVKNSPTKLPPYAYFLAGAAAQKTSLSVNIIFQMLEAYFAKISLIEAELQSQIEKYLYNGQLGHVKEALPKPPEMGCDYCYRNIDNGECIILENCCNMFHQECIYEHVRKNMSQQMECPACSAELVSSDIQKIDSRLYEEYMDLTFAMYLAQQDDVITCNQCQVTIQIEGETAQCPLCYNVICRHCKNFQHTCACNKQRNVPKLCPLCHNVNYNHNRQKYMRCGKCQVELCFDCNYRKEACACMFK